MLLSNFSKADIRKPLARVSHRWDIGSDSYLSHHQCGLIAKIMMTAMNRSAERYAASWDFVFAMI